MGELDDLTRERLFELVWSKPVTEVARELGVSDSAIGKLCRKLEVPKPPRGYWRRVATGQQPKQPPLPALIDEATRQTDQGIAQPAGVRLSPRRYDLFMKAAQLVGFDSASPPFTISGGRLTWIDSVFAASVIVALHHQGSRLGRELGQSRSHQWALERKALELIRELLPVASETIAVFPEAQKYGVQQIDPPTVLVRLTPQLRSTIASMAALAREYDLSHVVKNLNAGDHAWRFRLVGETFAGELSRPRLAVSPTRVWVEAEPLSQGSHFFSDPLSLQALVPENALAVSERTLPPTLPYGSMPPSHDRKVKRLAQASSMLSAAYDALHELSTDLDRSKNLDPLLALLLPHEHRELLQTAQTTLSDLHTQMEAWEDRLKLAEKRLAREIIDIRPGDIVYTEGIRGPVRLLVEDIDGHASEDNFLAHISGRRFRKDGLPGKREDRVFIKVPTQADS